MATPKISPRFYPNLVNYPDFEKLGFRRLDSTTKTEQTGYQF